jgi:hypothetical protein
MEDLNKTQIVLLTILISFVVSIATGIMTTALLNQAPVQLTNTVQQVVEKTIQSVTSPATPSDPTGGTKQVETIVVNEDDSVTSAITKNTPSVVRIHAVSQDGTIDNLYGMGIVVSTDGIIVTDSQLTSPAMNYSALMSDGTKIPLVAMTAPKDAQVGFFKAKPIPPYTFTPASLATGDLKLGQTIIALGGDTANAVGVGRVVSFNMQNMPVIGTSTPIQYIASVTTDVAPADGIPGAPIISLSGDIVGLSLTDLPSSKVYLPSALIQKYIGELVIAK